MCWTLSCEIVSERYGRLVSLMFEWGGGGGWGRPLCAFGLAGGLSQRLIGQKNQDIKMIDWGWGVSFTQSTRVKCMLSSGTHTHPHFPQMYIKPKR